MTVKGSPILRPASGFRPIKFFNFLREHLLQCRKLDTEQRRTALNEKSKAKNAVVGVECKNCIFVHS